MILQSEITLPRFFRGVHIIDDYINSHLQELPKNGVLHLFIKHTSAALAINEGADPDVRVDLEHALNKLAPDSKTLYRHNAEGPDDMPSHIKSILCGSSLTIPVSNHRLNLGTWQSIYLCEFRDDPPPRKIVITIWS